MYILIAILMFGFLIAIHELGHFWAAKSLDVQVNEFSICMGPAIFKKQKGETLYALRCIPIGGYCAMEGEDEQSDNPRAFSAKPWWRKLIILCAGSFMNFLAGLLLIAVLLSMSSAVVSPKISGFYENCPLASADGLHVGDEFTAIDGKRVFVSSDLSMLLGRNHTGVYDITVLRDGKTVTLRDFTMLPQEYEVDGQKQLLYGMELTAEPINFDTVAKYSFRTACDFARLVWMGLEDLFSGLVSVKEMSGPVGIISVVAQTGQNAATRQDALYSIAFLTAFIAINLAVMNMLPIPAMDGGRVFLLLVSTVITAVTKKKIPSKYESYIHAAGMVLLLALMAAITLKDIWQLLG